MAGPGGEGGEGDEASIPSDRQRHGGRWPRGGIGSIAVEVLRRSGGPLTLDAIAEALGDEVPRGPRWWERLNAGLRGHTLICRVGAATYDLMERRLVGGSFRHVLTAAELRHGALLAHPDLDHLLRWSEEHPFATADVPWARPDGAHETARVVPMRGPYPIRAAPGSMFPSRYYPVLLGLAAWLSAEQARAGDDVVFTPEAPDARRFRVALTRANAAPSELGSADQRLAETAVGVLHASASRVPANLLLRRVVGLYDYRVAPGAHLPVFVLGTDSRVVFDGSLYAGRKVAAERSGIYNLPPYPRVEDYPADWPDRDPLAELSALRDAELLLQAPGGRGIDPLRVLAAGLSSAALQRMAEARAAMWELLRDRAQLLQRPYLTVVRGGRIRSGR